MIVTLDTWFTASTRDVRAVADLAAEIGTERPTPGPENVSVWVGDEYGGRVQAIRRIPGATLALQAEIQRIVSRHSIDGSVRLVDNVVQITADIQLTSEGLINGAATT